MVPLSKVQDLISKHSKLEKELSSQEIDKKSFAEKSKEYSELSEIIKEAVSYFNFQKNKDELENLVNDNNTDKDMKDLAISELNELVKNNQNDEKKIKLFLLPKDEADTKNAMIEMRAGKGGLEASLFAYDLFKMYEKVSNKKKWIMEDISIQKRDDGGKKEDIEAIKGKNI